MGVILDRMNRIYSIFKVKTFGTGFTSIVFILFILSTILFIQSSLFS